MPKIYKDEDVYSAALKRFNIIFENFDNVYFSFSGGKDSSVMVQLAAMVARKVNKKFSILFIDLEAQYRETILHTEEVLKSIQDVIEKWYWVALQLSLRNAVSIIQPKWECWNLEEKSRWIRPLPTSSNKKVVLINQKTYPAEWNWFSPGMEFEDFILYFAVWFNSQNRGITGCGIGIRSNESLNRFRTIISTSKETFQDLNWTTRLKIKDEKSNIYNFYPLYDWCTEDIWTAVSKNKFKYNYIYELMYKNGLSIHEQRLCQPYGDDQKNGLDQFKALEPETWERVLQRVHGVNFGNIYCRTSLLGNIKTEKPSHMTWEEYTVFLLESLGIYSPELRDHYYKKIKTFFNWYKKEENIDIDQIKEEEDKKLETAKKIASWRRIARAIEKNDFWLKRLSFGQTKTDTEKLLRLKDKYRNIIRGVDVDDKNLKNIAKELEDND